MASKYETQVAAERAAKQLKDREREQRVAAAERQKEHDRLQGIRDYNARLKTIVSKMSIRNLPFRGDVPYSSYEDLMEITPDEYLMPLLNQLSEDIELITSILVQRYPKLPFPRKYEAKRMNGQRFSR
jgi:hypothetical protein